MRPICRQQLFRSLRAHQLRGKEDLEGYMYIYNI